MTYAELKDRLGRLTAEQLAQPVVWTGDERGGDVKYLWIAEEDWVDNDDGDCEPRSLVTDPEAAVVIPKGTVHLMVDD